MSILLRSICLFLYVAAIIQHVASLQQPQQHQQSSAQHHQSSDHVYSTVAKPHAVSSRRSAIQTMVGGVCAFGLVGQVPESQAAINESSAVTAALSFSLYNILPDASANLDPRIEKMDNLNFVRSISSQSGAVWLGEHHNSEQDHNFQNTLIRSIHQERIQQKNTSPIAIGLEQVQMQFQPVLDEYITKKISIEELRQRVEWDRRWMWSFDGYKPIFESARDLGIQLIALNVDSEDLSVVEKDGYPGLPRDRLRKYIKDPVGFGNFARSRKFQTYVNYVISPSYEIHDRLGLLKYTINGEKLDEPMPFRNFLSGRILWDEAMASAAYAWTENNPDGLMIGLVGADHVKFGNGIPGRFSRMAQPNQKCVAIVINPTLIDSRPSGSVSGIEGSDSSQNPDRITLQLRYLKDGVDPHSEERRLPENTGGVLPFADYIVVS